MPCLEMQSSSWQRIDDIVEELRRQSYRSQIMIWLQIAVEEEYDQIQESPRQGLRPEAGHADLVDVARRKVEGDRRVGEVG